MAGDLLIDVTRLLARMLEGKLPTGVDRVSLAYVGHFRARAQALVRFGGRWVVLGEAGSQAVFDALLHPGPAAAWVVRWRVALGYLFGWRKHAGALLLNVTHSGLDDPAYAREVQRRKLRAVYFLYDLIPITHPEYNRPGESERHSLRVAAMLKSGSGILFCSEATHTALLHFIGTPRHSLPPFMVAPLAPAPLPAPRQERPLAQPYFVVLGTIEPRKNHLLMLQVWRELVEEMGRAAPKLVIVGQRGWECEQVIDQLERSAVLQEHVIEKPRCSDAELSTWLYHARALLFPSFTEGYGMPLVEALAQGLPVIASDLPVFHEIAGSIPDYLDPLDGPGWKRTILDYLSDASASRARQIGRLAGFSAPSWEYHFSRVENFLESIDTDA